jgi:hypothetical protein
MRRILPSEPRDPESIAGIVRPHKRVREELRRLVVRPGVSGGVEANEGIPETYSVQCWQLPFRHSYSWVRRNSGRNGEV